MQNPEKRSGLSPALKVGAIASGVMAVVIGAFWFSGQSTQTAPSDIRRAPALDDTPAGQLQAESPRYMEILRESNDELAERALQQERSFVPRPENIPQPIRDLEINPIEIEPQPEPEPEPEVRPEPRRTLTVAPPSPPPPTPVVTQVPGGGQQARAGGEENPYVSAMISNMSVVARAMEVRGTMTVDTAGPPPVMRSNPNDMVVAEIPSDRGADSAMMALAAPTLIPAGTILYGETLTSSSSDMQSPVLVEITAGEFRGSRLIGTFTTVENVERMVVQFSSMTLPDGTRVGVTAFAVDGRTAETAVASDVNRRYVARYAPILAATFISGTAEALARPRQEITVLGDGTQALVQDRSTTRESLFAGVGASANILAQDLARTAPRGPEIVLRSGWPMGILFVDPVSG